MEKRIKRQKEFLEELEEQNERYQEHKPQGRGEGFYFMLYRWWNQDYPTEVSKAKINQYLSNRVALVCGAMTGLGLIFDASQIYNLAFGGLTAGFLGLARHYATN